MTTENPATDAPASAADVPPYVSLALPAGEQGVRTEGLSYTGGLTELAGSLVSGLPEGVKVSHVSGPNQAPVDPVAAGLDTGYHPRTRNEDRMISQTGTVGAGQRPSTFPDRTLPQAGVSDHSIVRAPKAVAGGPPAPAVPAASPENTGTENS